MIRRGLAVGLILASTVLSACQGPSYARPALAGLIVAARAGGGGSVRDYQLQGGQTVHVDLYQPTIVDSHIPAVGDLLLMGDEPEPWIATAVLYPLGPPQPCYELPGTGTIRDESIEFDLEVQHRIHLSIPKLPSFSGHGLTETGARLTGGTGLLCLDEQGRATAYW